MSLQIVILAAGQGKRMVSDLPKVLHPIAGEPMLTRVVNVAQTLKPDAIHVIVGHGGSVIKSALPDLPVQWITQEEQLGTGHALMQALPFLPSSSSVLVLYADVPLLQASTLERLIQVTEKADDEQSSLGLLLAVLDNPFGLGRIVRNRSDKIQAIVEEKDATPEEQLIQEIYSGICCAKASDLIRWLPLLKNQNAQKEYYLTDIIRLAVDEGVSIQSIHVSDFVEIQGVNNRVQLQGLERAWQKHNAERLMLQGVTLADAQRLDVRGELTCGKDVFIDVNTVFSGKVVLGHGCKIGPNCFIKDSTLGDHSEVYANSVIEGATMNEACHIGPFARLRPGTVLDEGCKIGNFVETKKAKFGSGSKASHLSYLGDVILGQNVNVGAGTITCNYDGVNKHETIIEDGVFIGSDTQLIAPVRVGKDATIGAGSTIRRNVPAGELTLSENKQKTVHGWKRPLKKT